MGMILRLPADLPVRLPLPDNTRVEKTKQGEVE